MALYKIILAVECDSDQQRDAVQRIANDVSNTRMLNGAKIVSYYPLIQQRKRELTDLFKIITTRGIKGLLSVEGAQLIARLTKT